MTVIDSQQHVVPANELRSLLVGDDGGSIAEGGKWHEWAVVAQALVAYLRHQAVPAELAGYFGLRDAPPAAAVISELLQVPVDAAGVEHLAAALDDVELLGDAYVGALSARDRHRLGEYYTPGWLVRQMIDVQTPDTCGPTLDPACGDARFLVSMIKAGRDPSELYGVELNPVAVVLARVATWLAEGRPVEPAATVVWGDYLLGGSDGLGTALADPLADALVDGVNRLPVAQWIVGNPPWVLWRNIGAAHRARLAERFRHTSLNSARGWHARVSAGQTDLSHLFVHEAAERVGASGRISFVLPRTMFTAPSSPMTVRSGRTSSDRPFRFAWVDDYSATDAFADVRQPTVVAVIDADETAGFPVEWRGIDKSRSVTSTDLVGASNPDDSSSSWLVDAKARIPRLAASVRPAEVRARGGVNTGGGNGIFYVEEIEDLGADHVRVRNVVPKKSSAPVVEAVVEKAFVRPLVRGVDIVPWATDPKLSIVFPYGGSDIRTPLPEDELRAAAPLTLDYLESFRGLLESRKELARWGGAWYSLFRIGPYTTNCWRVLWPHSGAQKFRSAVIGPDDLSIPDQKVVIVPFEDSASALLACAFLNSERVRQFVRASSSIDVSPSLLARLPLPTYDEDNPMLVEIVEAARRAGAGNEIDAARLASLFA
jgi:hypothetical protein